MAMLEPLKSKKLTRVEIVKKQMTLGESGLEYNWMTEKELCSLGLKENLMLNFTVWGKRIYVAQPSNLDKA